MTPVITSAKAQAASDKVRGSAIESEAGVILSDIFADGGINAGIAVPQGMASFDDVVGGDGFSPVLIDEVLTGGAVAENSPIGTVVGSVQGIESTDPNSPSDPIAPILNYALLDNAGGAFAIRIRGVITVSNSSLL